MVFHLLQLADLSPLINVQGFAQLELERLLGASLLIIGEDIQEAAGSSQLCTGQESGSEAAMHAIHKIFSEEETEAVLEVDAFNRLNRQSTLLNIQALCPSFSIALINTYRQNAELFIDGESVSSKEGTTQGDPLAIGDVCLRNTSTHQKARSSSQTSLVRR